MKIDITVLKKTDFIVSTVIALLILAWNLKNSFEFGRLAFVPLYDDVAYFNDAVVRYQKIYKWKCIFFTTRCLFQSTSLPVDGFSGCNFLYLVWG